MASTDTVIVACKIPNGLYLRIHEMIDTIEPSPAGGRKVQVAKQLGRAIKINGTSSQSWNTPEMAVVHGYALTRNVPRDFWKRWVHENPDSELLSNRLLFSSSDDRSIIDEAHENRTDGVKSGLEPLDPRNLPRGLSLTGHKIETADEQKITPREVREDGPKASRSRVREEAPKATRQRVGRVSKE